MSLKSNPGLALRTAVPEDSPVCGQICYDAFSRSMRLTVSVRFSRTGSAYRRAFDDVFSPGFYCVVAEIEGRIVGSNCLDERSVIAASARLPSTRRTKPGVGRKLMQAVMDRAKGRGNAGMRLVQAAFHNRSLSLYTSLGFDVREPLSCMQGRTASGVFPDVRCGRRKRADPDACNALSRRVHGFDRGAELAQADPQNTAAVVERGGRITGYATALAFFGHATAETNLDMQALIASAEVFRRSGNSRAVAEQCAAALVPREWPARRPADDADEHRAL